MTMNTPKQIPEEWLSAYLDGDLNPDQCRLVEAAISQNSPVAQQLDELRATRHFVKQLPMFPQTESSRWSMSPKQSWTAELDDGLDLDLDQPQGMAETFPGSTSVESLATATELQLNRTLSYEGRDPSSDEFRQRAIKLSRFRWMALAASLIGVAFLISALWPSKSGLQLGANPTLPSTMTGSSTATGATSDSVASDSVASDSVASDSVASDSVASGLSRPFIEGPASGEALLADSLAPRYLQSEETSLSEAAAAFQSGQLADKKSEPLATNALTMGGPGVAKAFSPRINAEPLPQTMPSFGIEQRESSVARGSPEQSSLQQGSSGSVAQVGVAAKVSWHRSAAWTNESVAGQLESNAILLPLRAMLRGTYTIPDNRVPDQSVPIAIVRIDATKRQKLFDKLQPLVTPRLPATGQSSSRLLFLSKDELDEVLASLEAAYSDQAKTSRSSELFWVSPAQPDFASELGILILHEQ